VLGFDPTGGLLCFRRQADHARLLPAHFAGLGLGLRRVLKTKGLFGTRLGPMLA
jgi:hypothetical protein